MKKIVVMVLFAGIICGVSNAYADEAAGEGAVVAEDGKWDKAGGEISEAAHAIGDATVDTSKKAWDATREGSTEAWDATKEGSAKAWDVTKEKTRSAWEKGKAQLHDATAPEPAAPQGE
jgi:hypothetical protein